MDRVLRSKSPFLLRSFPLLVPLWLSVCVSRPYLGFHFPADVLFGSIISLLLVAGVRTALVHLTQRLPERLRL
jgi:membrane-associated phospholipid phosphatase